jgi:hypothetical protein
MHVSAARSDDDEEFVAKAIDILQWLYKMHDPAGGPSTEKMKSAHAHYAIGLFSVVRSKLIGWADNHVAGGVLLEQSKPLADAIVQIRGSGFSNDAHELELLGGLHR